MAHKIIDSSRLNKCSILLINNNRSTIRTKWTQQKETRIENFSNVKQSFSQPKLKQQQQQLSKQQQQQLLATKSIKNLFQTLIIATSLNLIISNGIIGTDLAGSGGLVAAEESGTGSNQEAAISGIENLNNPIDTYYQPSLIGFRCETIRDLTQEGVSVIEANVPVRLTLFGELFTKDTIVAFTTEFQPEIIEISRRDNMQKAISNNPVDGRTNSNDLLSPGANKPPLVLSTKFSDILRKKPELIWDKEEHKRQYGNEMKRIEAATTTIDSRIDDDDVDDDKSLNVASRQHGRPLLRSKRGRFDFRMRTISRSYDCTDYDRVISYRLNEEDILSPNVAMLTVSLPELEMGNLYYFCIKQPRLTSTLNNGNNKATIGRRDQASSESDNNSTSNEASSNNNNNNNNPPQLIWVHQGDDWWVTLKVEAPTLTVTADCILMLMLLFLSAVTSGLNLGLMSLDMNELAVISSCGDSSQRAYARTIAPLRKRGNYLLCSLLLGNVMVNATLTVILEQLTSGVVAVIGSTLAIVVLGEIVPQAFCARQGLAIGAKTIYLTYAFMIITFPLSYPISIFLDYVLGQEEGHVYDREHLMEFIRITGHHTKLDSEEVAIISGALKLKNIKVHEIMTRIEDVFMLPIDCKLDRETIRKIIEKGYSRIPVYEFDDRKQISALILAKDLALLDPDDHTPIANMLLYCKHPLIFIDDDTTLDVALNEFKTGKSHMAVVRQIYDDGEIDKYYEAIGVVTLEDVIEEVLQVEINDETDTLSDNRRKRRRADAQVPLINEERIDQFPLQQNQLQQNIRRASDFNSTKAICSRIDGCKTDKEFH